MPVPGSLTTTPETKGVLQPLVQLFPEATAVRIPVLVSISGAARDGNSQNTVIEFGTSRVVMFLTRIPFEIDDRLNLRNADGSFEADAIVIAVQYQDQVRGVAARFVAEVRNWIIQA